MRKKQNKIYQNNQEFSVFNYVKNVLYASQLSMQIYVKNKRMLSVPNEFMFMSMFYKCSAVKCTIIYPFIYLA